MPALPAASCVCPKTPSLCICVKKFHPRDGGKQEKLRKGIAFETGTKRKERSHPILSSSQQIVRVPWPLSSYDRRVFRETPRGRKKREKGKSLESTSLTAVPKATQKGRWSSSAAFWYGISEISRVFPGGRAVSLGWAMLAECFQSWVHGKHQVFLKLLCDPFMVHLADGEGRDSQAVVTSGSSGCGSGFIVRVAGRRGIKSAGTLE